MATPAGGSKVPRRTACAHFFAHSKKTKLETAPPGLEAYDLLRQIETAPPGLEAYELLRQIGEGSFGRVWAGRRRCTGQLVALKRLPKARGVDLAALHAEVAILRGLDHENIVILLDVIDAPSEVVLVTEYAHGDLWTILCEDKRLEEAQVLLIARQLVRALHYLHSRGVVHRDLKPQNVLIGSRGIVKLCDFGFARASAANTLLTSLKGTPLYLAPEALLHGAYDFRADLWALGVMLYECAVGQPPLNASSLSSLISMLRSDGGEAGITYPPGMEPRLRSLLSGLLVRDPSKRLSWPELLHHPAVAEER